MRQKRIIAYFMLAVAILVAACASKDDQPESKTESETVITSENAPSSDSSGEKSVEPAEQNVEFKAIYVRTNGYHDGEKYPRASWITTPDEIQKYYEANKDKYYLESIGHPYSDQTVGGFTEAVKDYDEAFFRDYDLIFVVLEEGSGSIRHEVTAVKALRQNDGRQSLQTEITRLIPEVGTDDMAEWHVILEIPKEFGKGAYDLVEPIMKDKNTWDPTATEVEIPTADTASVVGPYGQISVYIPRPSPWVPRCLPMACTDLPYGQGTQAMDRFRSSILTCLACAERDWQPKNANWQLTWRALVLMTITIIGTSLRLEAERRTWLQCIRTALPGRTMTGMMQWTFLTR